MQIRYSDEDIDVSLEESKEIDFGVFVHTNVKCKFTISKYKKFKQIWINILDQLKEEKWKYVFAIPPSEKEEKWQHCFGFEYSGIKVNKHRLMRIKLWEV